MTELFIQLGLWRIMLLVALLAALPPLLWLLWVQLSVVALTYETRVMQAAIVLFADQSLYHHAPAATGWGVSFPTPTLRF